MFLPLLPKLGRGGAAARPAIHVPFISLMALFEAEGEAGPGTETTAAKLELNLAIVSSHQKEANHGNEEEKKEEDGEAGSRKVTTQARAEFASRRAVVGGRT